MLGLEDALKLPKKLDVVAAGELQRELIARRGFPLAVDGSAVDSASAIAMEVLVAGQRQWDQDALPFTLSRPSDALFDIWNGLGLGSMPPERLRIETGGGGGAS